MKDVYKTVELRLPIKLWLDDIESGALDQAENLANLPFAFRHIAIMPDSHQGYGMPIGAILATKGVIIPNAVGVDIGCGMIAVRTSLTELSQDQLKKIMGSSKEHQGGIRSRIPFINHSKKQSIEFVGGIGILCEIGSRSIVIREYEKARFQLGTLGGGNHFIEIQKGDDGFIWIMIHSGSRNLGHTVAGYYNDLAIKLNKRWFSRGNEKDQLAFLPIKSQEGQDYIDEMKYCISFAHWNRKMMIERVKDAINEVFNDVRYKTITNLSHNYARMEHHFSENVMVHRKGATSAKEGEYGIIPGSQGSHSYIVRGKGNSESFMSCSHGAGRKMSRTQAKKELSLEVEQKNLNDKGIIHSVRNIKDLDETTGAYKDIDIVMENQKDLVDMEVKLTPLAVIKG